MQVVTMPAPPGFPVPDVPLPSPPAIDQQARDDVALIVMAIARALTPEDVILGATDELRPLLDEPLERAEADAFVGMLAAVLTERLEAMADRLSRAHARCDVLEERLADTKAELRLTHRARDAAERQAEQARSVAAAAAQGRRQQATDRVTVGRMGRSRLAVNKSDAAEMLGCSVDFFDAHIAFDLPCVRRGRRRLYAVAAIERWLADQSERVT